MYEIIMLNEFGKKFSKVFENEYYFNKFLNKIKHSKKITLISYGKI